MAAKTPIRTVYTNNVATGLAEFQSGEFIDYGIGGTGLTALGSAGQVLKVNSGASALEYGNVEAVINIDGMTDGSGITIADTDKFAISDSLGTHLALINSQNETIAYYVFGRSNTDYSRSYVRIGNNPNVYLTDESVIYFLRVQPTYWGEKPKVEVPAADSTAVDNE